MKVDIQEITIPRRTNTPATILRIRLVYQNDDVLDSLPYVFILPGGPGANHSYYTEYDCLQSKANLVYYDPRGCGLSDKGALSTYTMNNYIDDLHEIKNILQLKTCILLGKSYGAMCALGYALRYPKDVQKLILAAGMPSYQCLKKAKSNVMARGTTEQQQICEPLWRGEFKDDAHIAAYFKIMGSMYSWKTRNNSGINRLEPQYPFAFEPLNEGFKNHLWKFDYTQQLKSIKCPTLILVGEEDWITDPIYSQEMASSIPSSLLHVFKNADHAMELDVPDLFFNTIGNFL